MTLWHPKKIVVLVVAALAVTAAGIGIAAWSTSGSGNAAAKAASASSLVLSDASTYATANLYPGATGSAVLRVQNPNSFPVTITTVTRTGSITSDKGAACDAATGVSFTDQSGLTVSVAASTTATVTLSSAVQMSNSSDNSCQGAVFTIPVTVTAVTS
jgi:hypothetical protein